MKKDSIGSEKELIERVREAFKREKPILVRAIKSFELEQLLKDGPSSFHFTTGTQYDTTYSDLVKMRALPGEVDNYGLGTIILYSLKEGDVGTLRDYDCYERKFVLNGWAHCQDSFYGSVEVYNIRGYDYEELKQLMIPLDSEYSL